MHSACALSIVIPAFNETARLPGTLRDVTTYLDDTGVHAEVIVVDDGSRDATSTVVRAAIAQDPRIRLIRLPRNRGKGYAVRVGVLSAVGRHVLFSDADGATPLSEVERLIAALKRGADIAIGSREQRTAGVQVRARLGRRIAGRLFHQIVKFTGVSEISDTQCGFKLFPADVAADLFPRLRLDGYAFDVELLLVAQRRGLRIAEVPVNWTHQPGSKINVVTDGLRMAYDVLRVRSYAMRGVYGQTLRMAAAPVGR
jgi:dolichyl-phosphate beta-glucosyltransferase